MTINECEYFIRDIQTVNGPLAELLDVAKAIACTCAKFYRLEESKNSQNTDIYSLQVSVIIKVR